MSSYLLQVVSFFYKKKIQIFFFWREIGQVLRSSANPKSERALPFLLLLIGHTTRTKRGWGRRRRHRERNFSFFLVVIFIVGEIQITKCCYLFICFYSRDVAFSNRIAPCFQSIIEMVYKEKEKIEFQLIQFPPPPSLKRKRMG